MSAPGHTGSARRARALLLAAPVLALACLAARSAPARTADGAPAPPVRLERTLDRDWTFRYFPAERLDTSAAASGYDDRRWSAVALPHTWSTYETTGGLHPFIRDPSEKDDPRWWHGWGWYRKRFVPGRALAGRKVFVEFDGVQKYSRVYLNGRFVGEHAGGYTSFSPGSHAAPAPREGERPRRWRSRTAATTRAASRR